MKNALVILAEEKAGDLVKTPKQFYKIGDSTILNTLSNLNLEEFKIIVIAINTKYRQKIQNDLSKNLVKRKLFFQMPERLGRSLHINL